MPRSETARKATLYAGLLAWAAVAAQITLFAGGEGGSEMMCLLCGERGLADATLNVAFFAPLGFGAAALGLRTTATILLGLLLSASIEVAQLFLPGRHPTLGDVVWNTAGTGAGVLVVTALRASARPLPGWRRMLPPGGYTALLVGGVTLAGWLAEPRPTRERFFGQWTPDLTFMPQYDGSVRSAWLSGRPLPAGGPFPSGIDTQALLRADWTLEVVFTKGSPPRSIAPVTSVYDALQEENLLLGVIGNDLVLRERLRSADFRLDRPDVRIGQALASVPTQTTVTVRARRVGGDRCIEIDGAEQCGLGLTVARIWSFLLNLEGAPESSRRRVDLVWLALLFLPLGLRAQSVIEGVAVSFGGAVAMALAALVVGLSPGPGALLIGALAGGALGAASRAQALWLVRARAAQARVDPHLAEGGD